MISRKSLLYALAYSAAVPTLMNVPYVKILALILSFPFMGGAWVSGTYFVQLFGSDVAYLFGAGLGIFIQVVLLLIALQVFINIKKSLNK